MPVPGASLSDVMMQVDMVVARGLATITFTNVSVKPETSAVFKEIVLDTYDDDTGKALLWNGKILTKSVLPPKVASPFSDDEYGMPWDVQTLTDIQYVSYKMVKFNGLPGYQKEMDDDYPMMEFQAKSNPVKYGLGPGESLQVLFNTSLADGSGIEDYLAGFAGGKDTADYAIGFHAISADILRGQSLSGVYRTPPVPEPGAAALVLAGASLVLIRHRRRYAV